jgi:hypothetical protein
MIGEAKCWNFENVRRQKSIWVFDDGGIAQSVEQRTLNVKVESSKPSAPTKFFIQQLSFRKNKQ